MAIKTLIESNVELKGDVILAGVADEEYASLGTEQLIKEYSADAALVCEPSNLNIILAHKGYAWIKVDVHGKAAHGSLANFGVDAIVKAGKFLVKVEELEKDVLSQKKHPLLGSPSIHASLINGGIELSTYPDHCRIELERRTLPEETRETVDNEIKELIKELSSEDKQFTAIHEVFFYRPGLEISKNEPIVESLIKASQNVLGKKARFTGFSGWMDSALLARAGIPTIIIGPKGSGAHDTVEFVNLKSLVQVTEILMNTIIDFCNT
jgi:acetylornithine deacetylase